MLELKKYFENAGMQVELGSFFGIYQMFCRKEQAKFFVMVKIYDENTNHSYGPNLRRIADDKIKFGSPTDSFLYYEKRKNIRRLFEIVEINDGVILFDEIELNLVNGELIAETTATSKILKKSPKPMQK